MNGFGSQGDQLTHTATGFDGDCQSKPSDWGWSGKNNFAQIAEIQSLLEYDRLIQRLGLDYGVSVNDLKTYGTVENPTSNLSKHIGCTWR